MSEIERHLGDGEQIVMNLHPHWRKLILPMIVLPIVVGVAAFAIGVGPGGSAYNWSIVGVAVLVLFFFCLLPYLRWKSTHYVVTNRRVLYRAGLLRRIGRDVPLYRLNDVHFDNSVLDRLTGCGDLILETAGEHGQLRFTNVPKVEDVQRTIYRLAEEEEERRRGPASPPAPPQPSRSQPPA